MKLHCGTRPGRPRFYRSYILWALSPISLILDIGLLLFKAFEMTSKWEQVAAAKRAALAESIPNEYRVPPQQLPPESQLDVTSWPRTSGWFSSEELVITDSTASHILQQIASKKWTSEAVTRAFCKRAAAAQQLVCSCCAYMSFQHVS